MNKQTVKLSSIRVEDDIIRHAAKQFSEQMDKEILEGVQATTLIRKGWTQAPLDCGFLFKDRIATTGAWVHVNATGDYKFLNGHWLFERAEDATMFILKFGNE